MASSLDFGSQAPSFKTRFHTRFRFASGVEPLRQRRYLNSLAHSSIGTPSPANWQAPTPCERDGFRFYFTAITWLLFTFPSRYWFTIGEVEYLALASSFACFPPGFHSRWYSRKISRSVKEFSSTGLLPSMVSLSRVFPLTNLYLNVLPRKYPVRYKSYPMGCPRRYSLTTPSI